jgi:hypothetical protein
VGAAFERRFEREVGATPAEFRRGLFLAHADVVEESGGRLRLSEGAVRLSIDLLPRPSRHIGLLELPVLHLSYHFAAGEPAACQALLARLDLAMQRGGG